MLADLQAAPAALILILLGGIFAAALWIGLGTLGRTDEPRKQAPGVGKVVAGPALRDGVWCRLVVYQDGYRRIEVLSPNGWVPSHRDVAHLLQAIPGRSTEGAPKP